MDKPNVRMFVGEFGTVRWETTATGKRGLRLTVRGPRDAVAEYDFPDPLALVEYQSTAERRLLNTGHEVCPITERRIGKDRRGKSRSKDRRRSE